MPSKYSNHVTFVTAISFGAVVGYIVGGGVSPLLRINADSLMGLLSPYLGDVDSWVSKHNASHFLVGSLLFISVIPNVVLMSGVTALLMMWLKHPRAVLYASLGWPIARYLMGVVTVMISQATFGYMDLDQSLRSLDLPLLAVTMFLVYVLFLALSVLLYRLLCRARHNPAVHRTLRDKAAQRR